MTHIRGGCLFITATEDNKVPKVKVILSDRAYLCRAYIDDYARFVQPKETNLHVGVINTYDMFAQCEQYRESVTNKKLAENLLANTSCEIEGLRICGILFFSYKRRGQSRFRIIHYAFDAVLRYTYTGKYYINSSKASERDVPRM